jgi:tRNA nucleotidyltransferase (CCA-adding enzyme)
VKIYQVGGSVRDELLGLPVKDRDYVVVGATQDEMIAKGFKPVGRDFPVFLHPATHEEYALARTERKHGRGHRGFVFHAAPDISLEADLARRDLTINAMARDESGALIDPYGGRRDLEARVLRHVGDAFGEDPLRVLRVARFAARFGFPVAAETLELMRGLVRRGELRDLSPERVWQEFSRGIVEAHASRMLAVLRECGALVEVVPELEGLYHRAAGDAGPDAGALTERALDNGAAATPRLAVQYAIASRHLNPEEAASLAQRLRASIECRDAALAAARHATTLERASALNEDEWLALLGGLDALRRPERLATLIAVCGAYAAAAGRPPADSLAIEKLAQGALGAIGSVRYDSLDASQADGPAAEVRRRRLAALGRWRREARG